jgi:hypothetical protein
VSYVWQGVLTFFMFAIFSGTLLIQIRQHHVERRDYAIIVQAWLFGKLSITSFHLAYLNSVDLDTFWTNRSLEDHLSLGAQGVLTGWCLLLLLLLVRTRRRMRKAWFVLEDKTTVPLTEVIHDTSARPFTALPVLIKMQFNLSYLRNIWLGICAALVVFFCLIVMIGNWGWDILLLAIGMIVVMCGMLYGLIALRVFCMAQRIQVTIDGLRVGRFWSRFIAWQDIQQFALLQEDSIEVSRPRQIIRCRYYANDLRVISPKTTYEEYEHSFDQLIATIAERTQLPLYDLRDQKPF